jgi:hypothetical protein
MPTRSRLIGARAILLWTFGFLTLFTAGDSSACAICFSGRFITVGQQLDAADQAVLALPVPNTGEFRVAVPIKGDSAVDATIAERVPRVDAAALQSGKPILLLRNGRTRRWTSVGAIGADYAGWLRQLAATSTGARGRPGRAWRPSTETSSELTDMQQRERLSLVVPYLENPEPLAAEIAHGEISRAPYAAMRSLKPQLEAAKIASWIDDPARAARHPTYLLLLGIAGTADDAARLEQRIDVAWRSNDATNLAAMLAAVLELRGSSRVGWIEQMYFADPNRMLPEIEAALLALGVHGVDNAAVPRERVIEAYRLFIRKRKPMAGFVAMQLADWGHWDATSEYITLLKEHPISDSVSHFAVINYLQRSPHPDAKAALELLAGTSGNSR